jgi:Family of unknown function (DUF6092)
VSDDQRLFDLAAFLVSSAGLTIVESPRHGAVRLLMAASRLVDSSESEDPFLRELKASIDENVVKVAWDYDGLVRWLNDLTHRVGAEALARQSRIPQSQRGPNE